MIGTTGWHPTTCIDAAGTDAAHLVRTRRRRGVGQLTAAPLPQPTQVRAGAIPARWMAETLGAQHPVPLRRDRKGRAAARRRGRRCRGRRREARWAAGRRAAGPARPRSHRGEGDLDLGGGLLSRDEGGQPVPGDHVHHRDRHPAGAGEVAEVVALDDVRFPRQQSGHGARTAGSRAGLPGGTRPSAVSTRNTVDSDTYTMPSREPRWASLRWDRSI
jgi:hypothetical protein